ncbi:MAG: DNA-3-methyladenine glycosylase [Anaerolineae bacterium]|nr:DNA-3-methyladenine glycosylase [Thermoflexus sp.]MDW8064034.1 DNA-3-methyladenine glycosylase [Anaerolineae bacterium]
MDLRRPVSKSMRRLPRSFFERPTLEVARDLLGRRLVRLIRGHRISGRIIEVEAYIGEDDLASHASVGRTARNAAMYGPPGHIYVYMLYGRHCCLNIVTEPEGFPAAILIRALEPEEGLSWIARRRRGIRIQDWLRGPGRVCAGLGIHRALNGHDLCAPDSQLWVEWGKPIPNDQVASSPRIRVRGDLLARTRPWRFYIRDHPLVSR